MDDWNPESYLRTQQRIAEGERDLRRVLEQQLRTYVRLLQEIASHYFAAELDEQKRSNPQFLQTATVADWQLLFEQARAGPPLTWAGPDRERGYWRDLAETAQEGLQQQQRQIEQLRSQVTALTAQLAAVQQVANTPLVSAPAAPLTPQAARLPAAHKPAQPADARDKPWLNTVQLPRLPPQAPHRFMDRLRNWPNESLVLAALNASGWSMRHAVAELLAAWKGVTDADAGSIRKGFETLEKNGFIESVKITLTWTPPTEIRNGQTDVLLTRLTRSGQDVLADSGLPPQPAEWDRLHAAHGGSAQLTHTAQVCVFAYQARRRGWLTQVCPAVSPPAEPDVLLTQADAQLYVEVEAESGTEERRLRKWRNQVALQGQAALCALTPPSRTNLINEARTAGAEHGRATDLQTLYERQKDNGPLWAVEW